MEHGSWELPVLQWPYIMLIDSNVTFMIEKLDCHNMFKFIIRRLKNACIHCSLRQTTGDIKRKECSLSLEELLPAMQGLMAARAGNAPTFLR